eukprot:jgi/Bigna1/80241/fgenesh1_pg.69_\
MWGISVTMLVDDNSSQGINRKNARRKSDTEAMEAEKYLNRQRKLREDREEARRKAMTASESTTNIDNRDSRNDNIASGSVPPATPRIEENAATSGGQQQEMKTTMADEAQG